MYVEYSFYKQKPETAPQFFMVHTLDKAHMPEIPNWQREKIPVLLFTLVCPYSFKLNVPITFSYYSLHTDWVLSIAVKTGLGFVNCTLNLAGYGMQKGQSFVFSIQFSCTRLFLQF